MLTELDSESNYKTMQSEKFRALLTFKIEIKYTQLIDFDFIFEHALVYREILVFIRVSSWISQWSQTVSQQIQLKKLNENFKQKWA